MKVSDVMTFGVATVSPDTVLADAARTMLDHRISGMPVVDSAGKLVGMLTDGDLVRKVAGNGTAARHDSADAQAQIEILASVPVHEVMATQVQSVDRDTPIQEAIRLLGEQDFRALPVIFSGRVIGMFSRPDLIRYLLTPA